MELRPRAISFRPAGKVLAVPDSAVVDTGLRKVVFVEAMPGMFDAVEVSVGAPCAGYYPVIRGLDAGQRVAAAGAFLLDAETRLNPGLAATYFGAARRGGDSARIENATAKILAKAQLALDSLSPDDRMAAARQKVCPVTRKALGSMGAPRKIVVAGKTVFLCCEGCEDAVTSNPAKYVETPTRTAAPGP